MNTELPTAIRTAVDKIIKQVVAVYRLEKITLFGSHAEGWVIGAPELGFDCG